MITLFRIPPFIVTLAMMLVGSGLAYLLAQGQSIYQLPDSFVWLGRGADLHAHPQLPSCSCSPLRAGPYPHVLEETQPCQMRTMY